MPMYELWRQDENGHRFLVGSWPAREEAERMQRQLERGAHKQIYEVLAAPRAPAADGRRETPRR